MAFSLGIDPGKYGGAVLLNPNGKMILAHLTEKATHGAAVAFIQSCADLASEDGEDLAVGVECVPVYIPNKGFRQQVSRLAPLFKSEGEWAGMAMAFSHFHHHIHPYDIQPRAWQTQPALSDIAHIKGDMRKTFTRELLIESEPHAKHWFKYELSGLTEAYWIARHIHHEINEAS